MSHEHFVELLPVFNTIVSQVRKGHSKKFRRNIAHISHKVAKIAVFSIVVFSTFYDFTGSLTDSKNVVCVQLKAHNEHSGERVNSSEIVLGVLDILHSFTSLLVVVVSFTR